MNHAIYLSFLLATTLLETSVGFNFRICTVKQQFAKIKLAKMHHKHNSLVKAGTQTAT